LLHLDRADPRGAELHDQWVVRVRERGRREVRRDDATTVADDPAQRGAVGERDRVLLPAAGVEPRPEAVADCGEADP
jgi:hypothetical protein